MQNIDQKQTSAAAGHHCGGRRKDVGNNIRYMSSAHSCPFDSNECIFCDEVNDSFNEDTLISHYYNQCPVLTNCPMCQIVSGMNTPLRKAAIDILYIDFGNIHTQRSLANRLRKEAPGQTMPTMPAVHSRGAMEETYFEKDMYR